MGKHAFLEYAEPRVRQVSGLQLAGIVSTALAVIVGVLSVVCVLAVSILSVQSYYWILLTLAYDHHLSRILPVFAGAGVAIGVWGWRRDQPLALVGMGLSVIAVLASLLPVAIDVVFTLNSHG